jgi:hypothetical protein
MHVPLVGASLEVLDIVGRSPTSLFWQCATLRLSLSPTPWQHEIFNRVCDKLLLETDYGSRPSKAQYERGNDSSASGTENPPAEPSPQLVLHQVGLPVTQCLDTSASAPILQAIAQEIVPELSEQSKTFDINPLRKASLIATETP